MRLKKLAAIPFAWIVFATGSLAHSAVAFDINVLYTTDSFTYDSESSTNRLFWDVFLGMSLSRKGHWVLGWNYGSSTFTDSAATDTSLTITDMGPKLGYYFDRDFRWSLFLTYNLITKGSYDGGGTTSELRGTSIKGELGYTPPISESFSVGIKLNYYMASFSEELTGTTTLDTVSHSRTVIYPSLAMLFRWE